MVCLEGMHSSWIRSLNVIKGQTYALTAAHVCEPEEGDLLPESGVQIKILLEDNNGIKHNAKLVKVDKGIGSLFWYLSKKIQM